ncbi:hypothetical protein N9043_02025 [bacterium]|nr:hypothetical protein [bacterium]
MTNFLAANVEFRSNGALTISDHANTIGWFSNRHNPAAGWIVTELQDYDFVWLKAEGIDTTNVRRVYTTDRDFNTSIVKFNLETGYYAFLDNEYHDKKNKFDKMEKFRVFMLDNADYIF